MGVFTPWPDYDDYWIGLPDVGGQVSHKPPGEPPYYTGNSSAPNSVGGLSHEAIEIFTRLDTNGDGFINILDEVQEGRGILGMPDDQRFRVSENHKDLIRLIEEFGFTSSNIGFVLDHLSSPNYIPDDSMVSHASAGSVIVVTATGAYVLQQGMKLVRGGRLGSADVRDLNSAIAGKLERAGWTIVRGGGRDKEGHIQGSIRIKF